MLHGKVIRPPAMGAKLEAVDEDSIKGIAGVVQIVREGNFLGIVARREWAAIKAARQLKATWSKAETLPDPAKLWEHVRNTKVVATDVTSNSGSVGSALAMLGGQTLAASYDFAIHTHGSMGPSCAVAEFKDGKLISWSASQATHNLRKQLARMFAMPVEDVRCIYLEGSGCYGRNGHEDAAADAAMLAKAVGRPVRVQWSRADEHGWDPKGPPTLVDLRAAIDAKGNVTAWDSEFFIPQQTPGGFMVPLVAADRQPHRPRQHLPEFGDALSLPERAHGLQAAGDHAVPSVVDPHARPDAEHLGERMLHGRTGRGCEGRSDRIPPPLSRSERQARTGGSRPAGGAREVGEAAVAASGRQRQRHPGPRRDLLQV
jgi:hypothetical protein